MALIEIRPIKKKEAEAFLVLLCKVFDLDATRARHVFFKEPMFDLARKWALFYEGQMVSILTTTPLKFGWGSAYGVAGVATDPAFRGQGLAQQLLERVIEAGVQSGERGCILFAHQETVYKRAGFETVDNVVKGRVRCAEGTEIPDVLRFSEVKARYDAWSRENRSRLLRDDRRWKYWKWILRTCEIAPGGYVCVEPSLCREAIVSPGLTEWPVMPETTWLGLESLTSAIGVPLESKQHDLFVMARGMVQPPQMFMTDQF